jgi:CelD/BcsL family acetyltransferase involved in cellulose biosynthesis
VHGTIDTGLRVEWRPLAELDAIADDWRALAGRALDPNVFYEPAFALAAASVLGQGVGSGLVWTRATPPRLIGFFPTRIERRRYGVPLPVLAGWTHPYAPLGVPLVDRDCAEDVIAAWLAHISADPHLPKVMLLPFFPADGGVAHALDTVLVQRRGRSVSFAPHQRALLAPVGERAGYLDDAIGAKKRKELRRQRKRLGDMGQVSSSNVGDASAIAPALDDFFRLEADGWKGRAGTAARDHANIAGFMTAAATALAGEGKASVARLAMDARAIAAMIVLRSGAVNEATAWAWKIAYDERYARFSPGVQILLDVTQALLDDRTVVRADSCASADHPMIDHVWRERLALADKLVGVGSVRSFALARSLEALRRAAIMTAKALRDRVKRR